MTSELRCYALLAAASSLLMLGSSVISAEPAKERDFEEFNAKNFDKPTVVDNEWFPLKPGTRYVWDGTSVDEEGDEEPHSISFVVTDLVKEIDGVQTLVCWDRDFADGELEEAEIVFFAQDNDGNVWHFGQYPEEYDEGELVATPTWIHGINDGKAGIMMKAEPKLGAPSYSQGLSHSTPWTDRAVVHQVGQKTKVPYGDFEDVLVIRESDKEEPNAQQLKCYARGVGNVRVGFQGDDASQETLELIKVEELSPAELAKAREAALKLEKNAYQNSKDIYGKTKPSKRIVSAQASGNAGGR